MKVLIVDDNEKIRSLLIDHLPANADEVYECADGIDALLIFNKVRPDWVLMDHEMPKMNGIAAIKEIIAEFPKANICMVTAFDDKEIRDEAIAAGATGFVLKDNLLELEAVFAAR